MPRALPQPEKSFVLTRLLLVVCMVAAGFFGWFTLKDWWASRLASKSDPVPLRQAIAIEPHNAENYDLLGRYLLFVGQDPTSAAKAFRQAISLNRFSSTYLLDLAQASYSLGNQGENLATLRKAIAVDPKTSDVAWNAGNFFLLQGDVSEAFRQFAVVLRNDAGLVDPVLSLCWRTVPRVSAIERILPPSTDVHLAFVRLLLTQGELAPAHDAWARLIALHQEFDYRKAMFYVNGLIDARDVAGAQDAWGQLISQSPELARYPVSGNLVVNWNFAEDVLNGGFDWRYSPIPNVTVSLDPDDVRAGGKSLQVTYGNSGADSGVYQYVPVDPNTRYTLSAWVKSDDLRTANGPTIAALDAFDSTTLGSSRETAGSTPWHEISTDFQTGKATKLVLIRFPRDPGSTAIRGRFWVNGVTLNRTQATKPVLP